MFRNYLKFFFSTAIVSLLLPLGVEAAACDGASCGVDRFRGAEPQNGENGRSQVKSSTISKDSILIGDQVIWKSVIDFPKCDSIVVEPYSRILAEDSVANKVEVVAEFVLDTAKLKTLAGEIEAKVILTSFDSGSFQLPAPQIAYFTDGNLHYIDFENTPKLEVNTIQVDTTGFEVKPIKGQIRYPVTFKEILPWILLVLGVAALVWLGWWLVKRYLKKKREREIQDPPHIVALRELDRIRSEELWQKGEEKVFYSDVTDALRRYIEKMYGVSAMEKTTAQIFDELKDCALPQARFDELHQLFQMADLVKFAKMVPDKAENESVIPTSVRFVNDTYEQYLEKLAEEERKAKEKEAKESAEKSEVPGSEPRHPGNGRNLQDFEKNDGETK